MKKTVYALLVAAMTVSMAACSSNSDKDASSNAGASTEQVTDSAAGTSEKEKPIYVVQDYLTYMPYCRKQMIDQLVYLGYDQTVAEKAVDEYGADWVAQAKRALEEKGGDMDHDAAIKYLTGKGFTEEEAEAAFAGKDEQPKEEGDKAEGEKEEAKSEAESKAE